MTVRRRRGLLLPSLCLAMMIGGAAGCDSDDDGSAQPTSTATVTPTSTATVTPTSTATVTPTSTPAPCDLPPPFCGGEFPLNTLETTPFGLPWANVILQPQDFIPCFGPYALCYYANCTLAPNGRVSDCPCFDWFGTYYVDLNAILNVDSYLATKAGCEADPNHCQQPNSAQVCADINRGDFLADAERISTFSFYRAKEEPIGSTDCSDEPGLYSGCMTAPCFGPVTPDPESRTATIACECPNWDGPFQVGTDGLSCQDAPMMTYSAAYSPNSVPPDPCDLVVGCVPDAPQDNCGCPLYDPGTTVLPPDSGVDCDTVCQEYAGCTREGGVELGYTCDATLCTSTDHDLVMEACLGLQNCDLSEVFKAETAAGCSCCASQLCNCAPNPQTDMAVYDLNAEQRAEGETPQCDINGTLCGTVE